MRGDRRRVGLDTVKRGVPHKFDLAGQFNPTRVGVCPVIEFDCPARREGKHEG